MADLLRVHAFWLKFHGEAGRPVNLELAKLIGADLQGANLSRANLQEANLYQANLQKANLEEANLEGAFLSLANLEKADLTRANLQGVSLHGAHLKGAFLSEANLEGAYLEGARLEGAELTGAKLAGANLVAAKLAGAILVGAELERAKLHLINLAQVRFEPKAGFTHSAEGLARIRGLAQLTFEDSSHALSELRSWYKLAGLRDQERQVTYAIRHTHVMNGLTKSSLDDWCLFAVQLATRRVV